MPVTSYMRFLSSPYSDSGGLIVWLEQKGGGNGGFAASLSHGNSAMSLSRGPRASSQQRVSIGKKKKREREKAKRKRWGCREKKKKKGRKSLTDLAFAKPNNGLT